MFPELISLTPDAIADAIAAWLTDKLRNDPRCYGVAGPHEGRVLAFLKHGDVLVVDVALGEVVMR